MRALFAAGFIALAAACSPAAPAGPTAADIAALEGLDLAEIAITSAVTVQEGEAPAEAYRLEDVRDIGVIVHMADGQRCERCWMVLEEVGQDPIMSDTCRRCATAVAEVADVSEVGS